MSAIRSIWRWSTAGFFSYLSWFFVNLVLAAIYPLLWGLNRAGARRTVRAVTVGFLRAYFLHILPRFGLYRIDKESDGSALGRIRSGLVVINHTSWLDALIIIALVPEVRPVVSTRYGGVPLVSTVMRWLGCVFVDRRDRASVSRAVAAIRGLLRDGRTVAVFPEGTRSAPGHLKPFQDVFFGLAAETACPVEPVLLLLDIPFLGAGNRSFITPRRAVLRILKLPRIEAAPGERGRDLAFRTRLVMRKAMTS